MYEIVVALLQPYTILWLILLVALVNLWCRRRETRGPLLLLTIPFVALQLVSTPLVAHFALGSLEWHYPPLERRPADCQAIVVLAGAILPPDEVRERVELTEDTRLRCVYAAQLYREGPACPVLVSGGRVNPDDPGPTCASAMAEFLQTQGVAAADLIVEETSRTTYENAVESARQLQQRRLSRIVLVVDAVDMVRAAGCFSRQGCAVTAAACRYRARPFQFSALTLVPGVSALRNSDRVWHEWLGLVWYWCWGRI